eukprot:g12713.t1
MPLVPASKSGPTEGGAQTRLPPRMDDWTKLDYYRFCLFQRQVQEEFQRENEQLRSRLNLQGFPARPQAEVQVRQPLYPAQEMVVAASLGPSLEDKAADALSKSAETEKCYPQQLLHSDSTGHAPVISMVALRSKLSTVQPQYAQLQYQPQLQPSVQPHAIPQTVMPEGGFGQVMQPIGQPAYIPAGYAKPGELQPASVQMPGAQRVGTNLTQVTGPEGEEDDDPNRLPTFVKVRGLPAEHDPRIARRPRPKKRAPGICCA